MKSLLLLLVTCAIASLALSQSAFVVVDKSEKNAAAVARYDREVRKRIDFVALREAVNEFITAHETVTVGEANDRYTLRLSKLDPNAVWRLASPYERVYSCGQWQWIEFGEGVRVWFNDYSVGITLEFRFTERAKCERVGELIEDRRYIIE